MLQSEDTDWVPKKDLHYLKAEVQVKQKSLEQRIKYLDDVLTENRIKASSVYWSWCRDLIVDVNNQTEYRIHKLKEELLCQNYLENTKEKTSVSTSQKTKQTC